MCSDNASLVDKVQQPDSSTAWKLQIRVYDIYNNTTPRPNHPLRGQLQLPSASSLAHYDTQMWPWEQCITDTQTHTDHCGVVELWRWMDPGHFLFCLVLMLHGPSCTKKMFLNLYLDSTSTKQPLWGNCCLCACFSICLCRPARPHCRTICLYFYLCVFWLHLCVSL